MRTERTKNFYIWTCYTETQTHSQGPEGPLLVWPELPTSQDVLPSISILSKAVRDMSSQHTVYIPHKNSVAPLKRARPRLRTIALLLQLRKPWSLAIRFATSYSGSYFCPLRLSLFPLLLSSSIQASFIYFSQVSRVFSALAIAVSARAFMKLSQAALMPILVYIFVFLRYLAV